MSQISELINATNPTGKVLEVIPVMRSDATSLAFHDSLVEAASMVKGIRLATPVMYDPSEYPKSDAFQVFKIQISLNLKQYTSTYTTKFNLSCM